MMTYEQYFTLYEEDVVSWDEFEFWLEQNIEDDDSYEVIILEHLQKQYKDAKNTQLSG